MSVQLALQALDPTNFLLKFVFDIVAALPYARRAVRGITPPFVVPARGKLKLLLLVVLRRLKRT